MTELGVIADWLLTGIRSRAVFPAIVFDRRWHPLDRCDMMSVCNGALVKREAYLDVVDNGVLGASRITLHERADE